MPRNSSGTYSTPAGQPVVSGTTISSATHNALVSDLATEISDSLSRSGKGGMTAPVRTPNGSLAAPTHSFTDDPDSGLLSLGANNPGLAVGGVLRQSWNSTGTQVNGTLDAGATTLSSLAVSGGALAAAASTTANGGVRLAAAPGSATNPVVPVVNAGGDVDVGTRKIANVTNPTNAQDAATKTYVDGLALVSDGSAGVTAGAGFTKGPVLLYKVGSVVFFNGTFIATAGVAAGTGATICTLPAGYRPTSVTPVGLAVDVTPATPVLKMVSPSSLGGVTTWSGVTNGNTHHVSLVFNLG